MLEAIRRGHEAMQPLRLAAPDGGETAKKKPRRAPRARQEIVAQYASWRRSRWPPWWPRAPRAATAGRRKGAFAARSSTDGPDVDAKQVGEAFEDLFKDLMRRHLDTGIRIDDAT